MICRFATSEGAASPKGNGIIAPWLENCAVGTPEGDDELAIFSVLAYSLDFSWMSIPTISTRTNLTAARVQAILDKHESTGLIRRHPSRPDLYGESGAVALWLKAAAQRSARRAVE
jgi:hypothetical protein